MFKKPIAFILIAAQLGLASSALATETPEFKLLSQSIALSGRDLSPEQTQAQMRDLFISYAKVAQPQGQEERTEEALIALNLYTPEQAHELTRDAMAISSESGAGLQTAMMTLMAKYPLAGAEYSSGCSWGSAMGLVGVIGAGVGIVFLSSGLMNTYLYSTPDHSEIKIGAYTTGISAFVVLEGLITLHHSKGCDD